MKASRLILAVLTAGLFLFLSSAWAATVPAPAYPKELTQKGWKKNKGIIAKIVKKDTGIGDLLKDCEAKWKAIDWNKLQGSAWMLPLVMKQGKGAVDAAEDQAKKYYDDKVESFRGSLMDLRKKAVALADEWKKSKKIPKKSRKYAQKIAYTARRVLRVVALQQSQ